jgi:hypothetical protein
MLRKGFALVAAVAVLSLVGVVSAGAIVGGAPDNGAHPYVVLLKIPIGNAGFLRCTGVLINGDRVITAAHCVDAVTGPIGVFFGPGPYASGDQPEAFATLLAIEPGYAGLDTKNPDTHDLAVLAIAGRAHVKSTQPQIAPVGYTDGLAKKSPFTIVGYGEQSVHPPIAERTRYAATSDLKNAKDPFNLRLTNNGGGGCFGDSGGPVLDGNVVVAILSTTQNKNCTSSSYGYRLDTPESHDFLALYGAI